MCVLGSSCWTWRILWRFSSRNTSIYWWNCWWVPVVINLSKCTCIPHNTNFILLLFFLSLSFFSIYPSPPGGVIGIGAGVTRVLGDGLAKLTFDSEYQESRPEQKSFGRGVETLGKVIMTYNNVYMYGCGLLGVLSRSDWYCDTTCER